MIYKVEHITKSYYKNKEVYPVLKAVSFEINENEFVVIMGESGAGKTTLMNCLGAELEIDEGCIYFDDQKLIDLSIKEKREMYQNDIGFIFQENLLINTLSVFENVIISCIGKKDGKQRANEAIKKVGIEHLIKKYPNQLSGGEKQRVCIARAIVNSPKVIFADEPTASLNPKSTNDIMGLLVKLNELGHTIILITHSIKVACFAKRLLVISDGNIVTDLNLGNKLSNVNIISDAISEYL